MNKSEIAEKREELFNHWLISFYSSFASHASEESEFMAKEAFMVGWERAIAESRGQSEWCPFCKSTRVQKLTSGSRCEECECQWSWGEPSSPPPREVLVRIDGKGTARGHLFEVRCYEHQQANVKSLWDERSGSYVPFCEYCGLIARSGAAQEVSPRTYTLIFMFTPDFQKVLLLKKATPEWQQGLWNGPGGIVEAGESEIDGAVRELREEATISLTPQDLTFVLKFSCDCERFRIPDCGLHYISVFAGIASEQTLISAQGSVVEPVELVPLDGSGRVDYLSHLLALCVMRLKQPDENGVEEVSPPSPKFAQFEECDRCITATHCSARGACLAEINTERDTRELKAALSLDQLMAEYCETRAISRTGKLEAIHFAQFVRQREVERLLG